MKVKVFLPNSKRPEVYYNVFDLRFTGKSYIRTLTISYLNKYTGQLCEHSLFTLGTKIEIED